MASSGITPLTEGHRIVEFSRPAVDVGLVEQIRRDDIRPYAFSEPGPWAEARCACGWTESGDVQHVVDMARAHEGHRDRAGAENGGGSGRDG